MEAASIKPAAVAFLLVLALGACSDTGPEDVVARVNGETITAAELDRRYAQEIVGADPQPTDQEAEDLKLQLLSEMISGRILLQLAAADDLTATEAEVDVRFDEYRSQYPADRFREILSDQQITVEELRSQMRETVTIEKLINKEITSRITVSDAEIEAFYNDNRQTFDLPPRYHLAHILVTPFRDEMINNQEGDDAATTQSAREKADSLLDQIQDGADFTSLARRFSEDPSTAMTGGDLGYQPAEAISALDPSLMDAVLEMEAGETLPRVVATRLGYQILMLIDKDEGGQKDLTDPDVKAQIRQLIFNGRDQTLRGAFYEVARNQARVENFLARRLLERAGAS